MPAELSGMRLSFVIPAYNEEGSVIELAGRIQGVMQHLRSSDYDITFVDDGSTDATWEKITSLISNHPGTVRGIRMRKNVGKATALDVGFKKCTKILWIRLV